MRMINGITIMEKVDKPYMFCNHKNQAVYIINGDEVTYKDPFGNSISNTSCHVRINGESFELNHHGEEIRLKNGTTIMLLPKEDIQDLANKTFYADKQFKVIDFLTNTITPE